MKVSDGTRTRDRLDHNQELYQLSYAHQARVNLPGDRNLLLGHGLDRLLLLEAAPLVASA